jgi:type II secretory pathway component PulC
MLPDRSFVLGLAIFMVSFASIAEQLRDPTRPPVATRAKASSSAVAKSKPRPPMILQTILISEDRQAAIISDRLMLVGDTISGYRLSEIRADEVILRKGKSARRTLRLFPDVHLSDARIATGSEQQKGPQ